MEQHRAGQRRGLSVAQRAELWARWKAGDTMSGIGRALGKGAGTIFMCLAVRGGIGRAPRTRAARALTTAEREQISRGLAAEQSIRAVARALDRPASTISREVARNGGRDDGRRVFAPDLDQLDEARLALDERRNVRVLGPGQQIAFPVPRDGAILHARGSGRD